MLTFDLLNKRTKKKRKFIFNQLLIVSLWEFIIPFYSLAFQKVYQFLQKQIVMNNNYNNFSYLKNYYYFFFCFGVTEEESTSAALVIITQLLSYLIVIWSKKYIWLSSTNDDIPNYAHWLFEGTKFIWKLPLLNFHHHHWGQQQKWCHKF